jgi:hypothetical protein
LVLADNRSEKAAKTGRELLKTLLRSRCTREVAPN